MENEARLDIKHTAQRYLYIFYFFKWEGKELKTQADTAIKWLSAYYTIG